jgi:hypothetical protein
VQNAIEVTVKREEGGSSAAVHVNVGSEKTDHIVHVADEDLERYGATDPGDLVRRSFEFLLEREPASSILREFRITDIEKYFPEYATVIRPA